MIFRPWCPSVFKHVAGLLTSAADGLTGLSECIPERGVDVDPFLSQPLNGERRFVFTDLSSERLVWRGLRVGGCQQRRRAALGQPALAPGLGS